MSKATVFYKLPGRTEIVKKTGILNPVLKPISFIDISDEVFLFSPYNSGNLAYEIQLKENLSRFEIIGYSQITQIHYDSKAEFISKANKAIETMQQSSSMSKVVLARCFKRGIDYELDINTYFLNLCLNYPNSFIYAVSSAITGTWIAATPETFLRTNYQTIETIALAGTMLSNSNQNWGNKEKDEQHKVEIFIEAIAAQNQIEMLSQIGPTDLITGHLKHLCTHFTFKYSAENIANFVKDLNPTPAVGGLPKQNAIDFITEHENLNRKFYTGFAGIITKNEASLYVNLRCMELYKNYINLYAGCGITQNSYAEAEWIETENKLKTLGNFLP